MADNIAELVKVLKPESVNPNNKFNATVSKTDSEGVVWVYVAGSDIETPTASTSTEVHAGDAVTVEWRNNKLYIAGNYSNPSAGVIRVNQVETVANNAQSAASVAYAAANNAVADAERARAAAESAESDAAIAATQAQSAASSASDAAASASQAQQSATSAGENASRAQAASEAAQLAALASITSDTIHYLATDLDSGVTTADPPAGHGSWSTTIQTMTETFKYLWTYHTYSTAGGSSTSTTPVLTGTYGEKGADGTSVTILGSYNTLAELQQAHPTGTRGDSYMVAGDLYVWNGSAWENVGQIQGPQGPQGVQGDSVTVSSIAYAVTSTETEPSSYPYSSAPTVPEGSWLWTKTTYSDGNSAVTKSKQGVSGTNGTDGRDGTNGTDGRDGTDGTDGISVTAVQPQYYLHTSSTATQAQIDTWNWSLTLSYVVGKYIWTRDMITYSDGTTTWSEPSTAIYNEALTQSCKDAAEALGLIEEQQEYFWHDSLGAHILSDKNTVTGTRYRTDIKGAGLEIFELDGQNDTSVAQFSGNTGRVGKESSSHSVIDTNGMRIYASDGSTTIADLGYGLGNSTSATSTKPYYSLGERISSASEYSSSSTYNIGDVCTRSDSLYVCQYAITTPESWTAAHWRAVRGNYSSALGYDLVAAGAYSSASGEHVRAIGDWSHAEGEYSVALGHRSHAENGGGISLAFATIAEGVASHAEGGGTKAIGQYSHSEGNDTRAEGQSSHVEGNGSWAIGAISHAQNEGTRANKKAQTAIGSYNAVDYSTATTHPSGTADYGEYAFIIGNGTITTRSNALTVDWNGNVNIANGASYKINGTSLIDMFYPVGSYYETSDTSFDPNTTWGGTWSLESAGTFHISAGTGYTAGSTGGSKDAIVVSHSHTGGNGSTFGFVTYEAGKGTGRAQVTTGTGRYAYLGGSGASSADSSGINYSSTTSTAGSSGTNANLPPYVAVNRWHRTA